MMALQFLYKQPVENRKDFRMIHEFRIRNDHDEWIRLTVQNDILELDKKGNPWLDLKLWDFAPIQDLESPGRFVLRNKLTGETLFAIEGKKSDEPGISVREKEVLGLIANGMRSKEIADKLFISANTVNNHRRNLIEKLNVSNSSEAVRLAAKLGII
jgi:DNA-binding CsgD family transcriptional regulator